MRFLLLCVILLFIIFISQITSAYANTTELIYLKDGTVIEGVVYKADSSFLYVKVGPVEKKIGLVLIDKVGNTKLPSQLSIFEKSCICPNCGQIAFGFYKKFTLPPSPALYNYNCDHCGKILYTPWGYLLFLIPFFLIIFMALYARFSLKAYICACLLVGFAISIVFALIVPISVVN